MKNYVEPKLDVDVIVNDIITSPWTSDSPWCMTCHDSAGNATM